MRGVGAWTWQGWSRLGIAVAVAILSSVWLGAGCLNLDIPDGLRCSTQGTCPSPYQCSGSVCVRRLPDGGTGGSPAGSGGSIGTGGGPPLGSGGRGSGGNNTGGSSTGGSSTGGSASGNPICNNTTTPDGPSACCGAPDFPVWCKHQYSGAGHCLKAGTDCSTVKVCPPETFPRACGTGDYVTCYSVPCAGHYGLCHFSEALPLGCH